MVDVREKYTPIHLSVLLRLKQKKAKFKLEITSTRVPHVAFTLVTKTQKGVETLLRRIVPRPHISPVLFTCCIFAWPASARSALVPDPHILANP